MSRRPSTLVVPGATPGISFVVERAFPAEPAAAACSVPILTGRGKKKTFQARPRREVRVVAHAITSVRVAPDERAAD